MAEGNLLCPGVFLLLHGQMSYRGRIAPTPTGYLHLGHARTFQVAMERARESKGTVVYRDEDLDSERCKPCFSTAAMEDLRWFGLDWDEGPDVGGPHEPYRQSLRHPLYRNAWDRLKTAGWIYPCEKSRKDVARAASAPHAEDKHAEQIYPPEWRPAADACSGIAEPGKVNWRFRVPDFRRISFTDGYAGPRCFECLRNFGDFVVWRKDQVPSYELAVVVDDAAMGITEVVRGEDLLLSTARQLLLYEALGAPPPRFFHLPLLRDAAGNRLAKRHASLSLRELREQGHSPADLPESSGWRLPEGAGFR